MSTIAKRIECRYLECMTEAITPEQICIGCGLNYYWYKSNFLSSKVGSCFTSLNFWVWYRRGKKWGDLTIHEKQVVIQNFAVMCGVNRGDFSMLPDDRSVFEQLRVYEKSKLSRLFCNTTLLNSTTTISDPFFYDSHPARRILLFLNLRCLEEQLPDQITPHWKHYKQMEAFARRREHESIV